MRNRGYIKKGPGIDVQIRDEYFVTANIMPTDREKSIFSCKLSIHDTESDLSVGLGRNIILSSTYKTVNKDTTASLNGLIDNGYFDEDVANIKNMLECLNILSEFQRKPRNDKEE